MVPQIVTGPIAGIGAAKEQLATINIKNPTNSDTFFLSINLSLLSVTSCLFSWSSRKKKCNEADQKHFYDNLVANYFTRKDLLARSLSFSSVLAISTTTT
jgi:hypothetical protein